MVSRASAVGCHPLREVPSLRRRGSNVDRRPAGLPLIAAVRAQALVAAAASACLSDHAHILSRADPLKRPHFNEAESAGHDLHGGVAVAPLPGLHAPDANGAIVTVTNAVQ